ncbi:MAG: tRNA (adenosine(37)-N6)-dimethylallyltransferase MiaA [Candidatus Adiutrix sp.]
MANDKAPLVIIAGPTGAGKSALGLELAQFFGGEIINADSVALYRGFDIGAAKPTVDEQNMVPHHLIDVLNPDENFDAAAYLQKARPIINKLYDEKKPAFAVGGTGFYLRSLTAGLFKGPGRDCELRKNLAEQRALGVNLHQKLQQLDPLTAARLAPADWVRIERALEVFYLTGRSISHWQQEHALGEKPFNTMTIIIDRPLHEMHERLTQRTLSMFERGLVAEVTALLTAGWAPTLKPFSAIAYKEVLSFLQGEITLNEALDKTIIATRRLAKRQRTWFRGQMPNALWFHPDEVFTIKKNILNFLSG